MANMLYKMANFKKTADQNSVKSNDNNYNPMSEQHHRMIEQIHRSHPIQPNGELNGWRKESGIS